MRLEIKNFSCLQHVDIDIDDFTVIIGEQASGKSLTCKIYFYLRNVLSNLLYQSIIDDTGMAGFKKNAKAQFHKIFPDYTWKEQKFEIILSNHDNFEIKISHASAEKNIDIYLSDSIQKKYKIIKKNYQQKTQLEQNMNESRPSVRLANPLKRVIDESSSADLFEQVIYIPSGRSFFSTLAQNVFGFLSENIGLDPFLVNFGRHYEFSKQFGRLHPTPSRFTQLAKSILKGTHRFEKNQDWLVTGDKRIAMNHASSGQQEALPLILVLQSLSAMRPNHALRSVVVEEPEAHLFPTAQKAMVELLFTTHEKNTNTKFLITTHSPYILSCINNSILKNKNPPENDIQVNAYVMQNGKTKLITNPETGLIDGILLDQVSDDIADEFYKLLENM